MKRLSMIIAVVILISIMAPVTASASANHVLICLIDRMNPGDLDPQNTPHLWSLMQQGAIGLLNSPSAGERNTENTYCSMSAGSRVLSSNNARLNFQAGEIVDLEKAGDVFTRNTGTSADDNNLVVSSIVTIKKNNLKHDLSLPGKLGDVLAARGDSAAVIGNSDLPGYYSRAGVLLVMDSRGLVENGKIDDHMIKTAPKMVYQSNYKQIKLQSQRMDDAVLVIEFGDLTRLNTMSNLYSPTAFATEKKHLLKQIDKCLGDLLSQQKNKYQAIYIISSSPDKTALEKEELLTPLIIVKPGFNGILTGISTRREGIVSSLAIKDSIISSLYPDQCESIASAPHPDRYKYIQELNSRIISDYVNQKWFLRVIFPLMVLMLITSAVLTWRRKGQKWRNFLSLSVVLVPLNLLLIANITVPRAWLLVPLFLAGNLVITAAIIGLARWGKWNPLSLASLLTILCITMDLCFGLGMLERSMMSYRIMRGSRYYGLGNEYMGVLIGSAIVFASLLLQGLSSRLNRLIVIVLFTSVIFLNAYPRFGINVGGTVTAAIALGYTYLMFVRQSLDLKKVLTILIGTLLVLVVMSVIDLSQPIAMQSHLGRNVNTLLHGGTQQFGSLLVRKMQMELRIINFTVLNWFILLGIVASCFLVFRPNQSLAGLKQRVPVIYSGIKGLIIAAITAIIFNDSGITAAASLFIYTIIIMADYWPAEIN